MTVQATQRTSRPRDTLSPTGSPGPSRRASRSIEMLPKCECCPGAQRYWSSAARRFWRVRCNDGLGVTARESTVQPAAAQRDRNGCRCCAAISDAAPRIDAAATTAARLRTRAKIGTAGACRWTRLSRQRLEQPPPEAMRGDDAAGSWEPGNEERPLPVASEITSAERV